MKSVPSPPKCFVDVSFLRYPPAKLQDSRVKIRFWSESDFGVAGGVNLIRPLRNSVWSDLWSHVYFYITLFLLCVVCFFFVLTGAWFGFTSFSTFYLLFACVINTRDICTYKSVFLLMLCVILVVMLGMKVCWLIFKVPALLAGSHGSGCVETYL